MIGFKSEEMCARNASHISSLIVLFFFCCYTVTNKSCTVNYPVDYPVNNFTLKISCFSFANSYIQYKHPEIYMK